MSVGNCTMSACGSSALVETSAAVAATRSRLAKRDALAALLRRAEPADIEILVAYLAGELRQRRTGVGWQRCGSLPEPADEPSLTAGRGRRRAAADQRAVRAGLGRCPDDRRSPTLFARATADEQDFLRG